MSDTNQQPKKPKIPLLESKRFMYFFMFSILVYILLCGYILIFSGSVFIEAIAKGWYKPGTSVSDDYALWYSFLTSFPCLLGVFGGIAVLSTSWKKFYKIKVLLFIPSAVWSTQLVVLNLRWGLEYWTQWLFLIPIMSLCIFILYCVVKRVNIPILAFKPGSETPKESSHLEMF